MEKQDPMHFKKKQKGEKKESFLLDYSHCAEVMNRSLSRMGEGRGKMERRRVVVVVGGTKIGPKQKIKQRLFLPRWRKAKAKRSLRPSRKSAFSSFFFFFSMRKKQLSGRRRTTRTHLCNQANERDFLPFSELFFPSSSSPASEQPLKNDSMCWVTRTKAATKYRENILWKDIYPHCTHTNRMGAVAVDDIKKEKMWKSLILSFLKVKYSIWPF